MLMLGLFTGALELMEEQELRLRVADLEARIARLEAQLGTQPERRVGSERERPTAVPVQETVPTPVSSPVPRQARNAEPPLDLERFLGLSVLGRVGIAAILVAAAYFGQLGWKELGPGPRSMAIYLAGLALIGLGALLRPRVAPIYVAQLWGGGMAMTYLAGVLACLRYEVFSSGVALVSLLVSAALGQLLARILQVQLMATIALAGAYAAPVLVLSMPADPTRLLVLLLALHTFAAWSEHRWRWTDSRGLAVTATTVIGVSVVFQAMPVPAWTSVLYFQVLWLALAAPELLAAARGREPTLWRTVLIFLGGLFAQVSVFVVTASELKPFGVVMALLLLGAGAWFVRRTPDLGSALARIGALLLPLGAMLWPIPVERKMESMAWSQGWMLALLASAVLLAATRRFTRVGDIGIGFAGILAVLWLNLNPWTDDAARALTPVVAAIPWLLTVVGLAPGARVFGLSLTAVAVLLGLRLPGTLLGDHGTWQALGTVAVGAIGGIGLRLALRRQDGALLVIAVALSALAMTVWAGVAIVDHIKGMAISIGTTPLFNLRTGTLVTLLLSLVLSLAGLTTAHRVSRATLATTALAGLFLAGLLELRDSVAPLSFGARSVAASLYILLFAAALLAAGFRFRLSALRWTALFGFALVVLKVALHDLSGLEAWLRVLATGALGAVLLLAALAYARLQRPAN